MATRKIAAVILGIGCLLGLAGCSQPSGSVAAVVNGRVISDDFVQQTALAVQDILAPADCSDHFVCFHDILQNQIIGTMCDEMLAAQGFELSTQEKDQWWQDSIPPDNPIYQLWFDPRTRPGFEAFASASIFAAILDSGQVDAQQWLAQLKTIPVQVNPRYGDWNADEWLFTSGLDGRPGGVKAEQFVVELPAVS
ncbi:MAG: hypothetical protein FWG08_00505 [Propionibacteriaceae bacterium]|nr:hypothetical protein [Propionibacteriaceae bacterium]